MRRSQRRESARGGWSKVEESWMSAAHSATEKGASRVRMSRVQRFHCAAHVAAGRREASSGRGLRSIELRCRPPSRSPLRGSGQRIAAPSCGSTAIGPTEADHAAELLVAVAVAARRVLNINAARSVALAAARRGARASQVTGAASGTPIDCGTRRLECGSRGRTRSQSLGRQPGKSAAA